MNLYMNLYIDLISLLNVKLLGTSTTYCGETVPEARSVEKTPARVIALFVSPHTAVPFSSYWNERHWSAKPSAQQCMWLYLLPCTFCFVPAYAQFAQRFQTLMLSAFYLALCLPCILFVPAYAKFAHDFLTLFTGLVQLVFSFPSWFHCSHTFHSFYLDQKTWSQRSHVFRLTGTAVLHSGHTFVGGILTANGQ